MEVLKTLKFFINISVFILLVFYSTSFALTYTVKRGDNLDKIARKYGVSIKAIISENNLKKPYIIRPGQKLKIPVKRNSPEKTYCAVKHKVRPGDSLIKIAKKYRVWVKDLKNLNNLKSDKLYVGQVLCIKKGKKKSKTTKKKKDNSTFYIKKIRVIDKRIIRYKVRKGDNLSKIAKKYNTTVKRIIQLNNLKKPYIIRPGQKLKIEKKVITYREEIIKKKSIPFGFIWPVQGEIIDSFVNNTKKRHLGVDIKTECNSPIKAAEDGQVIFAGDSIKAYGNLIVIRHAKRFTSVYGHVGKISVKEKQKIKKGEIIGYTGKLNGSEHCGIYFEIRKNGRPVDPVVFLNKKNESKKVN